MQDSDARRASDIRLTTGFGLAKVDGNELAKGLGNTLLKDVYYHEEYSVLADFSATVRLPKQDHLLNWAIIRYLGELPLFGISWVALILSLSVVLLISWLNETQFGPCQGE